MPKIITIPGMNNDPDQEKNENELAQQEAWQFETTAVATGATRKFPQGRFKPVWPNIRW